MNVLGESSNRIPLSSGIETPYWIDEFMQEAPKNQQSYYKNQVIDFYLFHGKSGNEFTIEECQAYVDYLKRVHVYRKLSNNVLMKKVMIITCYLTFLQEQKYRKMEPLL